MKLYELDSGDDRYGPIWIVLDVVTSITVESETTGPVDYTPRWYVRVDFLGDGPPIESRSFTDRDEAVAVVAGIQRALEPVEVEIAIAR